MTSSLVGSEMCIRDRSKIIVRRGWPGQRGGAAIPRGNGSKGGGGDTTYAVSYTHLTLPTICSV
eukprot:9977153-Prorocentrum_lima.AAC.1